MACAHRGRAASLRAPHAQVGRRAVHRRGMAGAVRSAAKRPSGATLAGTWTDARVPLTGLLAMALTGSLRCAPVVHLLGHPPDHPGPHARAALGRHRLDEVRAIIAWRIDRLRHWIRLNIERLGLEPALRIRGRDLEPGLPVRRIQQPRLSVMDPLKIRLRRAGQDGRAFDGRALETCCFAARRPSRRG